MILSSLARLKTELNLFLPCRTYEEAILSRCVVEYFDATFGLGNDCFTIHRSHASAPWTEWIQAVMDDLPHWSNNWVSREKSKPDGNNPNLFFHRMKTPNQVVVAREIAPYAGLIFDV